MHEKPTSKNTRVERRAKRAVVDDQCVVLLRRMNVDLTCGLEG